MDKRNAENIITLDYGSGGQKTSELIENLILPALSNKELLQLGDGAVLGLSREAELVFSTDSFVVSPYFFPGGDIGKLAVCGTVNDIAVTGGRPQWLSLSAIIEEGFPMDDLRKIVESIGAAAKALGVKIVTGDTKVVEKGKGDGIYLNTSGIGIRVHKDLSPANMREGDAVLVSGPVGDHGVAVMLARHPDFMQHEILSDCAPVCGLTEALFSLGTDLRVMRDPTRGGVATTLCEFAEACPEVSIELDETAIPVDAKVKAACDILGLDLLYCACEGRLLAVVASGREEEALQKMQAVTGGGGAKVIGRVSGTYPGRVVLNTSVGGTRVLTKLSGSQLPRIC